MTRPSPTAARAESALKAARRIAPLAGDHAAKIERERGVPAALLDVIRRAGLFAMCVPRSLGGRETEPAELLGTIEALARADGSTAWCVMIGATTGLLSAYLPQDEARAVYGAPDTISAGIVAPRGQALVDASGYRLSGRWPFVSGIRHSDWVALGCVLVDADGPRSLPVGGPDVRLCLVPTGEVEVLDTWSVSGLCGTGSHDVRVNDLPLSPSRAVSLLQDRPWPGGALYAFPLFGLLALGISCVALGIARGALTDLVDLAVNKTPTGGARTLAQRPAVQAELARAEAALRAARALVDSAVGEAWTAATSGDPLSTHHRLGLRLAATHATRVAAATVDAAYQAGGGSSIYESSTLQRRFRDVHVATQHMMVAPATLELGGRLLLGLPTDVSQL